MGLMVSCHHLSKNDYTNKYNAINKLEAITTTYLYVSMSRAIGLFVGLGCRQATTKSSNPLENTLSFSRYSNPSAIASVHRHLIGRLNPFPFPSPTIITISIQFIRKSFILLYVSHQLLQIDLTPKLKSAVV